MFPMRMKTSAFGILFLLSIQVMTAQRMTEVATFFSNSFREWVIYTEDEDVRGSLRMRWVHSNDWTAWDLTLGDAFASIEQKWPDQPDMWVIRCDNVVVTARTAWAGDFRRWKLNDGQTQINWISTYDNQRDEWEIDAGRKNSSFGMRTSWEGDPREWLIDDQLPDDVSLAMRFAMVFLTLHFSAPKL